ncbi:MULTISPECIES: helix-turn-helix domain-containing protein [unclassified Pseudodesulfovibrio]|uniref:helix-turn-helix domain-containing protein n=1 Tax=unclassified Pseudodesulfovibrio TaxID=2661612 RepID=UPI000FEBEC1E|nr:MULTISPECIES: helix-turn-helix domain-containing protein [unclassified Pseudodesulfovibrio]MCJ2164629.1 helix-turn-helix domain-containing protein [Pseudodesulfovibrio sp. S3-i]RWU04177.1 DNA-binding protein [Pseudodesulfovibrio sp. S3]
MERWLKMGAACEACNIHRDTMRNWCRDGVVVARQIPAGKRKDWRILESSLPIHSNELGSKALTLLQRAGL